MSNGAVAPIPLLVPLAAVLPISVLAIDARADHVDAVRAQSSIPQVTEIGLLSFLDPAAGLNLPLLRHLNHVILEPGPVLQFTARTALATAPCSHA